MPEKAIPVKPEPETVTLSDGSEIYLINAKGRAVLEAGRLMDGDESMYAPAMASVTVRWKSGEARRPMEFYLDELGVKDFNLVLRLMQDAGFM